MSGHSKWSQIKHKKGIADAKKGQVFSKMARAIAVAARNNPDPATNFRLKTEVDRARAVNMPNDNIERAIKRFSDTSSKALVEVQLAFIGPGGAGILVQAITDSSNRTIAELRHLASQHGGRMTEPSSVAWMFKIDPIALPPEQQVKLEALLDALDEHDDVQDVATNAQ